MFKKILIPLDGSPLAEAALGLVRTINEDKNAQVFLVQVVPALRPDLYPYGVEKLEPIAKEGHAQANTYIRQTATRLQEDGINAHGDVIEAVNIADAILDYATVHKIDLIAISSHGRNGFQRWLLGSVADKLVHGATIPVLLVRPDLSAPGPAV